MSSLLSWRAGFAFAVLAALPLTPWMTKYYMLLAFDALLFGTVAMSLDLLLGVTGLVSLGVASLFGYAGALFGAARQTSPRFTVSVSKKEIAAVVAVDLLLLAFLFVYTRIKGQA